MRDQPLRSGRRSNVSQRGLARKCSCWQQPRRNQRNEQHTACRGPWSKKIHCRAGRDASVAGGKQPSAYAPCTRFRNSLPCNDCAAFTCASACFTRNPPLANVINVCCERFFSRTIASIAHRASASAAPKRGMPIIVVNEVTAWRSYQLAQLRVQPVAPRLVRMAVLRTRFIKALHRKLSLHQLVGQPTRPSKIGSASRISQTKPTLASHAHAYLCSRVGPHHAGHLPA